MTAVKYDPELCERLVREAREAFDVSKREEPPCSCRSEAQAVTCRGVEVLHRDDCAIKMHRSAVVDAWLWSETNLAAMADQLEAARRDVERLRDERDHDRRQVRYTEQQRDGHRAVLNRIADRMHVVHEDPKIEAAVMAGIDERDRMHRESKAPR